MYNINYYLTRFLLSPFAPFLPVLLGICLLILFKHFDSVYFCDDITLDELKNNLQEETAKYKNSYFLYDHWLGRARTEELNSLIDSDEEEMAYTIDEFYSRSNHYLDKAKVILEDVRRLEGNIKVLVPEFKSKILDELSNLKHSHRR